MITTQKQRERMSLLLSFEFANPLKYTLALSIACGRSNSIPCSLGLFFRIADNNVPCPPRAFEIFEDLQHTYSWMKYYNTELDVNKSDEGVLKDLLN